MVTSKPLKSVYEQWVYILAVVHAVLSLLLLIVLVSNKKGKMHHQIVPAFLVISVIVCSAIAYLSMKDKKLKY